MSATVNEQPQYPTPQAIPPEAENASTSQAQQRNQQLAGKIERLGQYANGFLDDVVNPAIKAFLVTCDTNPRIAAIVSTPALLAFVLVVAFFILSASTLVLWSIFMISMAIVFVIIGGVMSLLLKLAIVLLATIPLVGMATGLLVAANGASKFIISKLPNSGSVSSTVGELPYSLKEVNWPAIVQGANTLAAYTAQGVRDAGPVLLYIRDIAVTLGKALYSALETAATGMNGLQRSQSAEDAPDSEAAGQSVAEPSGAQEANGISNSGSNLTRRTPYKTARDDVHENVTGES